MLKTAYAINALWVCLMVSISAIAETKRITVIYDEKPTELAAMVNNSNDVWVTMKDLARATRYVVKPQGVCRDELCFPLPKAQKSKFIVKQDSSEWFNLSEFARLIHQPVAFDEKNATYYFGTRAEAQNAYLESYEAPNFRLPDVQGQVHSLSDFRGKKVLLVTWASW